MGKEETKPRLESNNTDGKMKTPLYNSPKDKEYNNLDEVLEKANITGYCSIPGLKEGDWAVRVSGNGMYPKYSNGDLLFCRTVKESFIQWGKVYVIMTKTGLLVRKLKPSSKENCIMAETFSEDYPPFDIPKEEITDLAIVVASVKFE